LVKRLKNRLETLLNPPFSGQKELFKTSFQYKLLRFQTAIKEGGQGTETEEKRKEERAKGRDPAYALMSYGSASRGQDYK
jgi:hypothetical protein